MVGVNVASFEPGASAEDARIRKLLSCATCRTSLTLNANRKLKHAMTQVAQWTVEGVVVTWQKSFLSTPSPRETASRYTSLKNLLRLAA